MHPRHASAAAMLAQLPTPSGERFTRALAHGSMRVLLYAPRDFDDQTPHAQDELYFVVQGAGVFVLDEERIPFEPGDSLFVPARAEHRFETFSQDLMVWAVFYGPDGGEAAHSHQLA